MMDLTLAARTILAPARQKLQIVSADPRLMDAIRDTPTFAGALSAMPSGIQERFSLLSGNVMLQGALGGTNERADAVFQTLDGADLNAMWREFNQVIAIRNAQRDRLVNYLTYTVTNPIEYVRYPLAEDFEEASEYGEPVGIRVGPGFNMGFDFRWYDLAIRYTWQFLIDSSQAQIESLQNEALEADDRLVFNKVFKTLFNSLDVVSSVKNIPVNVYKLYNGDGMVPPPWKTYTFDGNHNHYLTSGASTLATAALTAIEDTLYHHGYSVMQGYKLVLLVNRQEGKVIRGATVAGGWGYTFIPSSNVGGGVLLPGFPIQIVGAPTDVAGIPVMIGTYGPFVVIEEDYIPAGYVVCLASNGPEALGNPIGIREHENTSMRGLKLIPGEETYPLKDSFYRHGFGSGIRHRGAGVVMQVTTNGSYTIPSIYA